ncbi:MAG: HAD family hydrolase [Erysipelotrichaceae bacterium]|nr:HAD family hydrolase [Erysipelotrichaceae bacterium]
MDLVRLLIFDLDNTLINYGGLTQKAWQLTCERLINSYQLDLDANKLANEIVAVNNLIWEDESKRPKGNFSFNELRTSIVTKALQNLNIENEEIVNYLVNQYSKCKHEVIYVFEDVEVTLKKLKKRGYLIALLTNGDSAFQREKLQRFDLEKLFDGIFIDGEQGVGKPEKRAYFNVLNYFKVSPNQACMIGDHFLWEVIAPKKYGLKAIWVNRGNLGVQSDEDTQADAVIKNIKELLNYFD